jgi:hypothetical protein
MSGDVMSYHDMIYDIILYKLGCAELASGFSQAAGRMCGVGRRGERTCCMFAVGVLCSSRRHTVPVCCL